MNFLIVSLIAILVISTWFAVRPIVVILCETEVELRFRRAQRNKKYLRTRLGRAEAKVMSDQKWVEYGNIRENRRRYDPWGSGK